MKHTKRILLLTAAAVACGSVASAQPATHTPKVVRLLTVGNSFSGNATRYLHEIAVAAGDKLILGHADLGGCSMERHWKLVEAAEADPKAEAGRPYTVTVGAAKVQQSLKEILASQKWDVGHDPAGQRS